ncbi:MAG: radical SAM protein [Candidatus Margulisbacteria bacterium]|nr:radical SAM protein [Candidatus Margulisiibacteriota bacterium]
MTTTTGSSGIFLYLTKRCNLNCRYCYVDKREEDMSFEVATKAIDLFLNLKGPKEPKCICFMGGEPLLKFELICQITEWLKKKYTREDYFLIICTNLTLLTKEITKYFEKNHIDFYISIDGSKKAHDNNRLNKKGQGTYQEIMKKMELLNTNKIKTDIHYVVDPELREDIAKNAMQIMDKWNCYITLIPCFSGNWNAENRAYYIGQLEKFLNMQKQKKAKKTYCDVWPYYTCGKGCIMDRYLVYPNGDITFSCYDYFLKNIKASYYHKFYIGNIIKNKINQNKILKTGKYFEKYPGIFWCSMANPKPENWQRLMVDILRLGNKYTPILKCRRT